MAARKNPPEYTPTAAQQAQAEKIAKELTKFSADAKVGAADKSTVGWIAVFDQKVVARAPDMDSILQAVVDLGLDLRYTFFRNCEIKENLDNV